MPDEIPIPALTGLVPTEFEVAVDRLKRKLEELKANHQELVELASTGSPLTLEQVQQALEATGTHPLNLTGLIRGV